MAFDKTLPTAPTSLRASNPQILANWTAIEAAFNAWHYFATGGVQDGRPRQGSAIPFFQDVAPSTRLDGNAFTATDCGTIWIDSNSSPDNQFNILTNHSPVTWTPISTEIIAVLLAAARTFADVVTFSVQPAFTKGITANNAYLQGRNAADGANIDMVKVTTSDELQLGAVTTLPDTSKLATSGAPAADAQIANKKYVDDQDTADHPTYTGGQSHVDGSGLITKMGITGNIAQGGSSAIVFGAAFPNAVIAITCTRIEASTANSYGWSVGNVSTLGFTLYSNGARAGTYYWIAIGY